MDYATNLSAVKNMESPYVLDFQAGNYAKPVPPPAGIDSYSPTSHYMSGNVSAPPPASDSVITAPTSIYEDALSGSRNNAIENSYLSQLFAREQMDFQAASQLASMEFNSREAAKNRDWQALMSNTAHQREVRDLLAAGLNPILSAMGGNGATTGSGATASSQAMSGSSGSVDTSANNAIASLVATALQAENNYEMNKVNAITNLAISEQQRNMQKDLTKMQIDSAQTIADKQAYMQKYSTDKSSESSKYAADMSYAMAQLSSAATMYAAATSAGAMVQTAGINAGSAQSINAANIENQRYMAEHYPTNPIQAGFATWNNIFDDAPGSTAKSWFDDWVSGIGDWYRNTEAWARGKR